MIKVTAAAAAQIHLAAEQGHAQNLALRIAARRAEDGSFEYGMGFDQEDEEDTLTRLEGIDVLISPSCRDLLTGTTLDYVEIQPGEHRFIFINPNDPAHSTTSVKSS